MLSGDGVALVVVPRARVVTADRASGWQVEDLSAFFSEAGLAPLQAFGAEVDPTELRDVLAPRDRATFRALSAFHPPELIDALLGPLYPEVARKVLVVCGKAAGEVPPVPALEPRGRKRRGAKRDGLLAVGDLFEERYYVERFVRAGSQGEVYRARDNVLDEPVALKLLTAYEAGRCLERLRAEAAVAGRLAGPELPRWLGAGRGPPPPSGYRVYGWVEGESLSQRLRAAGAVGLPLAARIARDLLRVLDRMERARLGPERAAAHGDVRVRNVILRPDGGACLIDFGLARPVERPKEPEPGRYPTDAIAPARDRFDAGAVIFEAAVGRPPWPGPADRGDKQAPDFPYGEGEATWPWPADDVPEPLRALVTGLLTTDPERRFSSAAAARAQAEQVWADLAGGADAAS